MSGGVASRAILLGLCLILLVLLRPAQGEGQGWVVDLAAGSSTHEALPGSTALGATLGVRRDGTLWLYLAGGAPLDGGLPWAAAGIGSRFAPASSRGIGLDVGGHGYGYRDRAAGAEGAGGTLEVLPLAFVQRGAGRLELRSGVVHHASSASGVSLSRTALRSDLRAVYTAPALRATGEARYLAMEEADYPYLGGTVELMVGDGVLWSTAGRWLSERIEGAEWGAGIRLGVMEGAAVYAAYNRDSDDPLYLNGARTRWSVGVTRALGAVARPAGQLPPPRLAGRSVTFRLPLEVAAEPPSIGGDFTGWETMPMHREGEFWSATLHLPPGFHRYAFQRGDGEWFVPEGVPGRVDDGFGGSSATVFVP